MRTTIAFADHLLPLVESGEKTVTIREGKREYGDVLTVTNPSGVQMPFRLNVVKCRQYPVQEIPGRDIEDDGFAGYGDFLQGMREFYPDWSDGGMCTVVRFRLVTA